MIFADLHAHPFLRPFENRTSDVMSRDPNDTSSVWFEYDLPKCNLRHIIGDNVGFTTYSESDFTRAVLSSLRLLNVSLYPPESGFFQIPNSTTVDKIISFLQLKDFAELELSYIVSSFSKDIIKKLKSADYDYFEELKAQISYLVNTQPFTPDPSKCVGTVYSQIKNASYTILKKGADANPLTSDLTLQLLVSIEGGNCLWSNTRLANGNIWNGRDFNDHVTDASLQNYKALNTQDYRNDVTKALVENTPEKMNQLWPAEVCNGVLQNLKTLLSTVKLFSFTLSHHYYNGLAGHCNSLQPLTALGLTDQQFGINSELTHLGYMVINELLKNNVVVDVKHMSWKARQSYYRFRKNNYPNIPIVWSHAAVSGRKSVGDAFVDTWKPNPFYTEPLNLFDDDIYETVNSGGLIGIELDQRINGVKSSGVETLWKQFKYIAEQAASLPNRLAGQTVWDCMCIGSDYDGIIHPVDDYKSYDDFKSLDDYLASHIKSYIAKPPRSFLPQDMLSADEILAKLCFRNMTDFVKKHFK